MRGGWNRGMKGYTNKGSFRKRMKKHPKAFRFPKGYRYTSGMSGKHHSEATKKKIGIKSGKTRKGRFYPNSGQFKSGMIPWNKGKTHPKLKKLWEDKNYKEKTVKSILKGLMNRPTSLEEEFIEIIKKHNLPYKYVGDGSFFIDCKNPDFININGKKICIEVANTYHHSKDYPKERIKHFKKYGWKCFVFRTNTLDERVVLKQLGEYYEGQNI